ncbi:hypothetical protein, partial [Anabaena azotica]
WGISTTLNGQGATIRLQRLLVAVNCQESPTFNVGEYVNSRPLAKVVLSVLFFASTLRERLTANAPTLRERLAANA